MHWASVKLTGPNSPGDIVAMAISSDVTGRYATESVFTDTVGRSFAAGEWQVDANHNHLVAVANVGSRPADALLTLHYDNGTKSYEIERTIQPGDQMRLNLADLIRDRTPDRNGNVLPPDLSSGTYDLRDLSHGAGSLLEGSLALDHTWGFNGRPPAQTCCADYVPGFNPAYISVNIGGYVFTNILSRSSCSENYEDVSEDFDTWWSSNPPTAGVTTEHVTGVAPGLTNANASGEIWEGVGTNCSYQEEHASAPVAVPKVTCTASVTRGSSATCTVTPSGVTVTAWQFKDAGNHAVNRTQNVGSLTWSGVMVTTGTVSVTVSGLASPVTASVTVTARNWRTAPASPASEPNGTFYTLPVPPQPTGLDSGLGESKETTTNTGFSGTTISDGGPNSGYTYYASGQGMPPTTTSYEYEINPDLSNTGSTFYSEQCGNYNPTTNPGGFISGSDLLTQTNRHEWNSATQSHYAFYSNSMSGSNNPGNYVEARIAAPGANLQTFDNGTSSGLTAFYNSIYTAFAVEPYAVNDDASGHLLGNINYAPYSPCN